MSDSAVLIVGTGPTGLTLACDLRSRGAGGPMRNKSEAPDERDALIKHLHEFIRFGFATGSEARMIVTAIFFVPPSKVITFNRQSVIGIF